MAESKDALTGTGHHPTSAELRSEIERTRAEMDETFDALERKMTPGQILEEVWFLTRGGTRAGASKLWHIAREHPLPATVIGLGVGWLLVESTRGDGRSSRTRLGRGTLSGRSTLYESSAGYGTYPESYNTDYLESWETSQDSGLAGRASSAAGSVKHAAAHAKDAVKDAASSAGHKVADVAGTVRERAADLGHRTREKASGLEERTRYQARRAQTGFWELMEENPLAVGVATLALGVLAGLSLPSTRREDELLGDKRDRLVDRLEEVGREALDKGKHVAGTAVETLKEEVQNSGLTPSGLAEKAREVGRHTKEAVKEEVKSQGLAGEKGTGTQGTSGFSTDAGLTTGGVTTPSATAGTAGTAGTTGTTGSAGGAGATGSTSGTSGTTGSRGRSTPRETIKPVEQPELSNKR